MWGDEVEFCLLRFDHEQRRVRLNLRASDVLLQLQQLEAEQTPERFGSSWKPEYARYMLEGLFHVQLLRFDLMVLMLLLLLRPMNSTTADMTLTTFLSILLLLSQLLLTISYQYY